MADEEKLADDAQGLAPEVQELGADTAGQTPDTVDERVEAAVRHVAEEAEAEALEAQGQAGDEPTDKKPRERRSKQARAERAAHAEAAADEQAAPKAAGSGLAALGVPAWLGICAASLVLGLVLGRFVLGASGGRVSLDGKTTVSEAELDDTYAAYTYNGKTNAITVREVIEQNGTLDAAKTEDGSYTVPSAEYAVNAARNAILMAEVESRGIEVSDEDVAAYAESALGTSDYDAIASTYGMEADAVKELIAENCRINTLREQVLGSELPQMPEAPKAADEGKENEVTKEYADYVIALAGDEWDGDKGEWVSKDSAYATALDGYDFSADGASYTAAQTAYYVAYQQYSEKQTEMSNAWSEFVNGLMSQATIQVGTLLS